MGGYICLLFARAYPEMCYGIVASGCANETTGFLWNAMGPMAEAVYSITPRSQYWKFVPMSYPDCPKKPLEETMFKCGLHYEQWLDCHSLMLESRPGFWVECISGFNGPILFINGERDFRNAEKKNFLLLLNTDNVL